MLPEFSKKQKQILEDIKRLSGSQDTSTFGVSMAAAQEAQATIIKLVNPVIITPDHRIVFLGTVFAASLLDCKKVVQCRHTTPGVNRFPKIVEDMLKAGDSKELSRIGRIDMREARVEISNLQMIYTGGKLEQSVVFLIAVNPITPVTEYTIDGRHTSGVAMRPITAPFVIEANSVEMEYTSSSGVKISDGRVELHGIGDFIGPNFIINGVQNNISEARKKSKEVLGDALTIISGAMLAFGVGFFFIRRGRLLEAALPLVILGGIIFYIRHFTDWGKEYFVPSEIEISGEAPMEMSFVGELV